MKAQRWINILTTFALVVLLFGEWQARKPEGRPMAINYPDNSATVSFGTTPTSVSTPTSRTWMGWINITQQQATDQYHTLLYAKDVPGGWVAWSINYHSNQTGSPATFLTFTRDYTIQGLWIGAATLTVGTWYHIAVTYAEGTANDPIIYLNGAPVAITEISTPSGTVEDDSDSLLYVGGAGGRVIVSDLRIYPFITSAADIVDIYNSRCANVHPSAGLPVFAPMMYGAAGLQAFDGGTLAAANKIVDPYSGALGTPAGSPVGVAETYLSVCP